jgi:Recombination endonuclease VII
MGMAPRSHPLVLRQRPSQKFIMSNPDYARMVNLRDNYNLSIEDYDAILKFQGGVCAGCGKVPGKTRLHVDHRHSDGLVRGLICWSCNSALGKLRDSEDRLERLLRYIKNPPATQVLGRERFGLPCRTGTKKSRKMIRKIKQLKKGLAQ